MEAEGREPRLRRNRETLEWLRTSLSRRGQIATAVFHEQLSPARRDIEVARFRGTEGPSLLVSTECGGEGRNFEFCDRIVLFDLPWNPGADSFTWRLSRSKTPHSTGRS